MHTKCFCAFAKGKWKHFALLIYLFYCCLGAPGAETGGGPEAGKGGGRAAELELEGRGLAAHLRVGEMKSEVYFTSINTMFSLNLCIFFSIIFYILKNKPLNVWLISIFTPMNM